MMVNTAEVVALMTEMPDGRVRRVCSKRNVDVNKICNQFDGGGHAKAAGCRLEGPLEVAYTPPRGRRLRSTYSLASSGNFRNGFISSINFFPTPGTASRSSR